MAIRWQDDIIVIDAGLMFPEEELLGVDIVVPDISYLTENREKVRAILLTHGHEDHIGGLPWILSELNVPVYGTEFTLALVEGKLEEHNLLDDADLIEMVPGRRITLGPFSVMPIRVTHSLVDCVALAIHTPVGVVLHTGDFKVDLSPPDDKPFDLHAFAELGKQGVLALLQDSTNVDRSGYTPSERAVRPRLDEIFSQAKKKLFFSCFSSSIHRIRLAMELALRPWAQGCDRRTVDGQCDRDCAGPWVSRSAAGTDHQSGTDQGHACEQAAGPDQRDAGRADERAEPGRGEQPQVRADRCGRYGAAEFAGDSGQ